MNYSVLISLCEKSFSAFRLKEVNKKLRIVANCLEHRNPILTEAKRITLDLAQGAK